jgi:hypothetical protein
LVTAGYFWRILFTPDAWKPAGGGDLVSFLFPTYRFAAAQLHAGHLPLWNPYQYGGVPFLADMQTGVFYPPNLLLFLLNPDFSYKTMEVLAVLHIFLAGVSMFLFLRYSEPGHPLRTHAALLGAVAFMFSDLFVVHFGNLNIIAVAAWLPLVALLFWRSLRSRRLGLAVAAGVALGIATLAGHLQITLYTGLGLAVAAVVDAVQSRHMERGWTWSLLALAVTGGVAIGLSAMVLLPALQFAQLSPRAALSYQDAARYSLVPALLGEMLVPALFSSRDPSLYWGVWDRVAAGYLGVFPLILAGLAVLLRRGRRIGFLVVLTVVGFLLALGGQSVIHGWAYLLIPGFRQIRAPARIVVLVDFGLAALAAIGLDRLLSPLEHRARILFNRAWHWLLRLFSIGAVVGAAWAYLVLFQAQGGDPTILWRVSWASDGVIWALLLLAAALAWLGARRARRLGRRMLAWLAIGLVFVDLASGGAYSDLGDTPPDQGFDHQQVVGFLKSDSGWYRIDSDTDVANVWQPDLAEMEELYDVSGVDNPLLIADMVRYWGGIGGRSAQLYDLLGVRYVIASKQVTLDWSKFTLAYDGDPTVNVYRNETAMPRAFVVYQAEVVADHESAWNRLHQSGLDLASSVILEGGRSLDSAQAERQATVQVLRHDPDVLEFQVECPTDGYLVVSDPYYPGWEAAVDGQPTQILRADYALRAVAVPAGAHRITMVYRPVTWRVGLVLTAGTALAVLVLAVVPALRLQWRTCIAKRRKTEPSQC